MKRIYMLVIALLFIVAVGFCQEPIVLNTNSSTVGKYNKPTKKWVYDKAVKTEMTIKVYDDYIRIYDQAHSIYRIIEEKEVDDEEVLYNARCLDEKNTSCFYTLIKTKSDDQYYVMIMYPNKILYVYRVN